MITGLRTMSRQMGQVIEASTVIVSESARSLRLGEATDLGEAASGMLLPLPAALPSAPLLSGLESCIKGSLLPSPLEPIVRAIISRRELSETAPGKRALSCSWSVPASTSRQQKEDAIDADNQNKECCWNKTAMAASA